MSFRFLSRVLLFLSLPLVAFGLFARFVSISWDFANLFFIGAGFLFFVLSVCLDFHFFKQWFRLKSTQIWLFNGALGLSALFIVILLNYFMAMNPMKWDVSDNGEHTLSDLSRNILQQIDDELQMVYLYIPNQASKSTEDKVILSVRKYQDESRHISFRKYNVLKNPAMAKRYNLNDQEQGLFMTYKGQRKRFYDTDEESMTQTMIRLIKGDRRIIFATGHKEQKILDTNGKGLSYLKKELMRLSYDVVTMNLNANSPMNDKDLLVVSGANMKMSDGAQDRMIRHFKAGGRLMLLLDPLALGEMPKVLSSLGLSRLQGTVHMDNPLKDSGSHMVTGIVSSQANDLLSELVSSVTLFYVTGALKQTGKSPYKARPLMVSIKETALRQGYTQSDKKIADGPFDLIYEVSDEDGGGRAIIAADSDLFANQFLYQQSNAQLMFSLMTYLLKDKELLQEAVPLKKNDNFLVTDTQYRMYLAVFIMPYPLLLLCIGGFIWFRRRWL